MTFSNFETPDRSAMTTSAAHRRGVLRYLSIIGLAFLALMMALEPDVGFTAPPAARLVFWTLQIAAGLLVLQSVLYLLARHYGASLIPNWSLVLLSGVFGCIVLAPLYWLIGEGLMQSVLGYPIPSEEAGPDPIGDALSNPLLKEYLDIIGPVTTAWLLICLPRMHWMMPPLLLRRGRLSEAAQVNEAAQRPFTRSAEENARDATSKAEPSPSSDPDFASAPVISTSVAIQPPEADLAAARATPEAARALWLQRLPSELGADVIAVASELQYLRVWTSRGCALILGALADVETESAAYGVRVHRSWWVVSQHIVSVRRTAAGTVCFMSDGRQVPVSRRRSAEVLARFGDGARYHTDPTSKIVADTELH
jgi:hypothetical protein